MSNGTKFTRQFTAQGIKKEVLFLILYICPLTVNNACTLITTLTL